MGQSDRNLGFIGGLIETQPDCQPNGPTSSYLSNVIFIFTLLSSNFYLPTAAVKISPILYFLSLSLSFILKLLSSHCCCQNITNPLNHFHTEHSPSAEGAPSVQNVFGPKIYILTFTSFLYFLYLYLCLSFVVAFFFSP